MGATMWYIWLLIAVVAVILVVWMISSMGNEPEKSGPPAPLHPEESKAPEEESRSQERPT